MTNTLTVEIPADVKDNSTHTVQVRWRDTIAAELDKWDIEQAVTTFGYTVHRWDDVDRDGNRVTITRMDRADGRNVWLYETSYFTRVPCVTCDTSWASVYQTITNPAGESAGPVARCDMHAEDFRRAIRGVDTITLHESERLRIGQHD